MKDDWAIVLDYLPQGYQTQLKSHPVAQVIGTENFTLLEVVPREDITLKLMDNVYIGEGKRDQIKTVACRIDPSKLTATARIELNSAVEKIVETREKSFVDIVNIEERFLRNLKTDLITNGDLDYLAKELNLTNTAFFNSGTSTHGHWNVILNSNERTIALYDPLTTDRPENVRTMKTSEILNISKNRPSSIWLSHDLDEDHIAKAKGRQRYGVVNYLIDSNHDRLKEANQIINKYGAMQDDGCNCSLYCLFFSKKLDELSLSFY